MLRPATNLEFRPPASGADDQVPPGAETNFVDATRRAKQARFRLDSRAGSKQPERCLGFVEGRGRQYPVIPQRTHDVRQSGALHDFVGAKALRYPLGGMGSGD